MGTWRPDKFPIKNLQLRDEDCCKYIKTKILVLVYFVCPTRKVAIFLSKLAENLRIDGFLIKIRKCLIFASIHPPPSLNQGQGSVLTIWEYAHSIPRIKLPLKMILLGLKLITPNFDAFFSIFWPPKKFFRIFRCAQSISRARKPPSIKNQPI